MPKTPHEALHHLFRDDPDLVRRALKECLGEDFPEFREVAVVDSDLTEIKPIVREVDTVLRVETDRGAELIVIEPQSRPPKQEKKRAWHWYLSYLEAYFQIPATLIILTAERATAAECLKPMTLGPERRASATVHPLVIGPDNAPLITDPLVAADDVMLTVLAALANRLDPAINTALDTLAGALDGLDLDSAKFFAEYVEVGLGEGGAHDHWKGIIMTMTYQYASELRRELEARGEARGRASALLDILAARDCVLTEAQRDRIESCTNLSLLRTWTVRAVDGRSVAEVLDGPAQG